MRRNAQPHRQRADRVQPGVQRRVAVRWRGIKLGQRPARALVTAQPALAVGLHPHTQHLGVGGSQEIRHLQALLGGQARGALEHQCLLLWPPAGPHKQVAKGRMGFIGGGRRQRDFKGRHQLDVQRTVAQVAHLHLAELDVVFGADPDRGVGLHFGPGGIEADAVGVVSALVVRGRVGRGMLGDGHRARLAVPAQVEKAPVSVAQRIVAPARDVSPSAAAPARTVGPQCHMVVAVRQQVRGLQRRRAR